MKFKRIYILFFALFLGLSASAQLQAGIALNPATPGPFCGTPKIVNFIDQSQNATSCTVDYGNGVSSTSCNGLGTTYSTPGVYTVTQTVSDGVTTATATLTVTVYNNPTADFSVVDNTVCAKDSVEFINSSAVGDAPLTNCGWSFGGGIPNVNFCGNPKVVYTTPGCYNVTLVVIDANTCQSSITKSKVVCIDSIPQVSFTASPAVACTSPATISFTNTSRGTATLGSTWSSGDTCNGGSNVPTIATNFSHTFNCEGCFKTMLTVNNTNGCRDTASKRICVTKVKADFTASTLSPCTFSTVTFSNTSSNGTANFRWELYSTPGNNLIASSNTKDWSYVFPSAGQRRLKLIMTLNGCIDSISRNLTVSDSIPLSFTLSPNPISCTPPLTVTVTGSNVPASFTTGWTAPGGIIANPGSKTTTITYNQKGVYTITYTATNAAGCISRATKVDSVKVTGLGIKARVTPDAGCAPLSTVFNVDSPTNVISITWNLNPPSSGTISGGLQQSYTYTTSGTYNPWVRLQQANGCFDTFFFGPIIVGKASIPNFTAAPLVICKSLQPIKFTNTSTDGNGNKIDTTVIPKPIFTWSFNGAPVTGYAPTYVFDEPGKKTIALTVDNNGCVATKSITDYVEILGPKAEFSYSLSCSNPQNVVFNNTSSSDADVFIWNFGDGSPTSPTKNPTHLYSSVQSWSTLLIAKSTTTGCVDSMRQSIILSAGASDFTSNVTTGCAPLSIKFNNLATGSSSEFWNFGDTASGSLNTSNAVQPTHVYNKPGLYTVKLINNPNSQCPDTVVKVNYIRVNEFTPNFTSADSGRFCNPKCIKLNDASKVAGTAIGKYTWYFGDNTVDTSNTKNPTHCYLASRGYDVRLTITDTSGRCTATKTLNSFFSGISPDAAIVIDTVLCVGEVMDYNIVNVQNTNVFLWDFGDGTTSTVRRATHTFPAVKDTYQISVIITEPTLGCKDTIRSQVKVDKPFVDFYAQGISANCPPLVDSFYNISSRPDLKWHWSYGDGDTTSGFNGFHIYQKPGAYTVTLIGEGINGCTDTMTKVEYVKVGGPKSKVVIEPPYGCNPLVTLTKGIIYDAKSGFYDHDDASSITQLPIVNGDTLQVSILHTYTVKGTYVPKITVTDSLGCQVTYELSDSFYVDDYPTYNLPTDTSYCAINGPVSFDVTAYNGVKYQWTPTDFLNCDTCAVILTAATDTMTYTVNVTSPYGCTTTKSIILNVEAQPNLNAGPDFNLCREETRLLNAGDVYNATWTATGNPADDYLDNPNLIRPTVTAFSDQTWVIYSTNRLGCGVYDTLQMTVIDSVVINTSPDTAICLGDIAYLQLTGVVASINDTDFVWTPAQFVKFPDPSDRTSVAVSPTSTTQFTITASSPKCKIDTEYITVIVNPLPDIILERDTTVAIGTPIELVTISATATKYEWFSLDPLSCTDCVSSIIDAKQDQQVVVYVTNQYGCKAADSIRIRIVPCDPKWVFVPNTFTPNDDGLNDKLFVRGKALSELNTFIVSDRWGKIYYNSNNIEDGWDGTFNGQQAQTNTYVWYVKAKCSNGASVEKSGTISLIR